MPVWYNDKNQIDGKSVYLKNLWVRGERFISDFVDNNGSLLTYTDFCDLFHIHLPFTTFYGIRRTILNCLPDLQHYKTQVILPFIPFHIRALKLSKDSMVIYNSFVSALSGKQNSISLTKAN